MHPVGTVYLGQSMLDSFDLPGSRLKLVQRLGLALVGARALLGRLELTWSRDTTKDTLPVEQGVQGFEKLRSMVRNYACSLAMLAVIVVAVIENLTCRFNLLFNKCKLFAYAGDLFIA